MYIICRKVEINNKKNRVESQNLKHIWEWLPLKVDFFWVHSRDCHVNHMEESARNLLVDNGRNKVEN